MNVEELITRAEKKIKGGLFGWGGQQYSDAAELYVQAANKYMMSQNREKAAELFTRAAECHIAEGDSYPAIIAYQRVAQLKTPNNIDIWKKIVTLASESGYWNHAAKAQESIAIYHDQNFDYDTALVAYQKTLNLYSYDNNAMPIRRCSEKMATLLFKMDRYLDAIKVYEELAQKCLDGSSLKYSYPGYVVYIVIGHLANTDLVAAQRYLEQAREQYPGLETSSELRFLSELVIAVEKYNLNGFVELVRDRNRIQTLDNMLCELLLKIKLRLAPDEDATIDLT